MTAKPTSSDATLGSWLGTSISAFDVLVGDRGRFPSETTFIDQSYLDTAFERAFPDRLGAFPLHTADPTLQKIALHFAKKLASVEAKRLGISANGLKHAWFHALYAEMMTLVPVRHLARKLYKANKSGLFAIHLEESSLAAISYWRQSALEPVFLAGELRRLGAKVCLHMDALRAPDLQVTLSSEWRRKWHLQFRRDQAYSTILCKKHIRRDDLVAEQSGASRRLRPGLGALVRSRNVGRNDAISLSLLERPALNGLRVYSAPAETPTLLQGFAKLMSPPTIFLRDWLRRRFRGKAIKVAHISDHASLEGGLLAAEVLAKGGEVHLWPHSANVVDVNVHDPQDITQVTLAARSTAMAWARKYRPEKVSVDIRTVLPKTESAPVFDEAHPIHVVLFGGAHALQRVPFFALKDHKAAWTTALSQLRTSGVDLTIKHKSQWETRDWIRQRTDTATDLRFSRTHATALDLPNMVFMSISLTSTALFEGIARGIPGIVVRDVNVFETPYYDPDFIPCIRSDTIAQFLNTLNNRAAWNALRDRQLEWFARETSWSGSNLQK